ncbi:MAG: inositol monophosphatase family protein, partial [Gemmatimonadota bacterium]
MDPIDGTRSYIAGYREFAVSVALAEDGEAVVGVVYNRPAARFSGRRGTGRLPRGGLVGRHCPEPHVHGVLAAAPGLFAP